MISDTCNDHVCQVLKMSKQNIIADLTVAAAKVNDFFLKLFCKLLKVLYFVHMRKIMPNL